MRSEVVLVACTANVCRSPLAAMLLRAGLARDLDVRVESAGTHARDGDSVCPLVARRHPENEWDKQSRRHGARKISTELLARSGLILAASRDIRSEIVRLDPEVRDRTFTFREAAHGGVLFEPQDRMPEVGIVAAYAAHLDRARATMAPVPPIRRWWRRGTSDDSLSILDGHRLSARLHRTALKDVSETMGQIVAQLNRGVVAQGTSAIAGDIRMP